MARLAGQRDYVFRAPSVEKRLKEVAERSLSKWFIKPEAIMPGDIAAQAALRERYFQPCLMMLIDARQARGASVATLIGIPILLATDENEGEEDINRI